MSGSDFVLTFEFPVDASTLYPQFATAEGVHHWWTKNCQMEERVGGRAEFPFPDVDFYANAIITRLDKDRCVEWEVTESKHPDNSGWIDLHDWVGTKIRFELSPVGEGRSRLRFVHADLTPLECSDSCSSLWQFYLNQSLRNYLEHGEGEPYEDGKSTR